MSYTVRQLWLDPAKYAIKAPHAMKAKYITIHNTANDASAANEIAFMHRNSAATSYHVAIDDKEAIEAIPFARNAWHAGDGAFGKGNRESIGIEICYSKSGGKRYEEAEANAIEYTAHALVQLGLPASAVKFHQEWSGKNCPHRILDEKRGAAFKQAIADRVEELKRPAIVKPAVKPPEKVVEDAPKAGDIKGCNVLYVQEDGKLRYDKQYKSLEEAEKRQRFLLSKYGEVHVKLIRH